MHDTHFFFSTPCMIFKLCWKFNLAKKNTCNLIAKHSSAESPDECDQCKKTFGLEGDMQDHKLTHSEDQLPHKSVQCSKSFPFASKLKIHRKIHSGEKLHYCSQCNKSFTGDGTLNKHVLVNSFWRKGTPAWKMQLLNQSSWYSKKTYQDSNWGKTSSVQSVPLFFSSLAPYEDPHI